MAVSYGHMGNSLFELHWVMLTRGVYGSLGSLIGDMARGKDGFGCKVVPLFLVLVPLEGRGSPSLL